MQKLKFKIVKSIFKNTNLKSKFLPFTVLLQAIDIYIFIWKLSKQVIFY